MTTTKGNCRGCLYSRAWFEEMNVLKKPTKETLAFMEAVRAWDDESCKDIDCYDLSSVCVDALRALEDWYDAQVADQKEE